jgi:hypothetical protein
LATNWNDCIISNLPVMITSSVMVFIISKSLRCTVLPKCHHQGTCIK